MFWKKKKQKQTLGQESLSAVFELTKKLQLAKSIQEVADISREILHPVCGNFVCCGIVLCDENNGVAFDVYSEDPIAEEYLERIQKKSESYVRSKCKRTLKKHAFKPDLNGAGLDDNGHARFGKHEFYGIQDDSGFYGVVFVDFGTVAIDSVYQDFFETVTQIIGLAASGIIDALHGEQKQFESLVENMSEGVLIVSASRDIVIKNPAGNAILSRHAGRSKTLRSFEKAFGGVSLTELLSTVFDSGRVKHVPTVTADRYIYELFVVPITNHSGDVFSCGLIFHDITERTQIEKTKSEFLAIASHQLRTPLTAIRWSVELLQEESIHTRSSAEIEMIEDVHQSTKRMIRFVNELLNVSRVESGQLRISPQNTDLVALIDEVVHHLTPIARAKNCVLTFNKPRKKIENMMLDADVVWEILYNIIHNGIKYSSKEKDSHVDVRLNKKKDEYVISVEDNGIGIPKMAQERIFEKFYRGDHAIKHENTGTGLGLYIAKTLVDSFSGQMWFKSKKNKGTQFYISIPSSGMKPASGEIGLIRS